MSEREAKRSRRNVNTPGEATSLPESMLSTRLEENHGTVEFYSSGSTHEWEEATRRAECSGCQGVLRTPSPVSLLLISRLRFSCKGASCAWASLSSSPLALLSSPGVWMPTTSAPCPPAVSVACILWGTCGWMTTLWQKSLSRLSEVYQRCRPWPWPWTKYTTYQTTPLETSPAWWFCKFYWFFSSLF